MEFTNKTFFLPDFKLFFYISNQLSTNNFCDKSFCNVMKSCDGSNQIETISDHY